MSESQKPNLNFDQATKNSQGPKPYMKYSFEERVELLRSIRETRENHGTLTPEQETFLAADREYYGPDDAPYK
ncbi:hypothetical protein A3G98_01045 [Candidatus Nomurabacteria bacterium RIFCSPLOWO2_12_FULL_37_8]|uniref:Uncharacterized protein n=1 Tax=Candidatus Nomurabacteria bacterium RIFCSPLOWO2_12_FULL_37_8 TaxID=1801793 RepID=A0A1F6Y4L9_9BACT|nr:MAG: hypothetical protein A3G98_01045 [Candidatus Nomurabacteria bacterium RIFCSPLOWO2_12_FULL_37_8]